MISGKLIGSPGTGKIAPGGNESGVAETFMCKEGHSASSPLTCNNVNSRGIKN